MFKQHIVRMLVFVAILSVVSAWLPVSVQARGSQNLPNGLQESVRAALGQNYRPMQFPNTQQAKLLAGDKASRDYFGYSAAISGDGTIALIGAFFKSDSPYSRNGAAYIFVRSGTTWIQQAKLLAEDRANEDSFGIAVALSADGNTVLVGALNESDNPTTANGAVYVFTRSGANWTQQTKLLATNRASGDSFGAAVALSADGDTALIGATGRAVAYAFTRTGTSWVEQAQLVGANGSNNGGFGQAVALSADGNTALIGASMADDGNTSNNGTAYIFARNGSAWTEQARILASDKANSDSFGLAVALSADGTKALIGAPQKSDSPTERNGAAYVFIKSAPIWLEQQKLLASDKATGDYFGYSVALASDGLTALVGAVSASESPYTTNGAAYVFSHDTAGWILEQKLLAQDRANSDSFGQSVAISSDGNIALIGAHNKSDAPTIVNGAAYIFVSESMTPTPTLTATNTTVPSLTSSPTSSNTATFTPSHTVTPSYTPTDTPIPPRPDTIGVYQNGVFSLRNSNDNGAANITAAFGGDPSDFPVVGDWNGDSVDTIGVYRSATGFFFLSDSNTSPAVNYTVLFGNPGDMPFAGRWTADMTGSGIGVYRNSNGILYQKKQLVTGFDDFFAVFGNPGDQGVAGDWDGNGFDSIGIYRASNQTWFLTNNSTPSGITFSDIDFVWNIGDHLPVVGDWDGDGDSTVGYLTASGVFVLHPNNAVVGTDNTFAFGPANSKPVAGKWTAGSNPAPRGVIAPITGAQPGGDNIPDSGDGD